MKIVIVGNDLRTIALARVLLAEGHEVLAIPGFFETKLKGLLSIPLPTTYKEEPAWQQIRRVSEILSLVNQLKPDLVVCLHVESSDVGLIDALTSQSKGDYLVFGVNKKASQLETSKAYGISVAHSSGLAIPSTEIISQENREQWLQKQSFDKRNLVVKANGLAGGCGSIFTENFDQLKSAFLKMPNGEIIVQEKLVGYEVALSLLCHPKNILPLNINFEYKREYENDLGLNTPGMGTVARSTHDLTFCIKILKDLPIALEALNYIGPLDINFIIAPEQQKAFFLEFTTRFGDPELSSEILMLKNVTSLLCNPNVNNINPHYWNGKVWAMGVIATGNYHNQLQSKPFFTHDSIVINSTIKSCFSAAGKDLRKVRLNVYDKLHNSIRSDSYYRKDIGHDALLRFNVFKSFLEF
jgi:phosphoribosylamine---glycine ligase